MEIVLKEFKGLEIIFTQDNWVNATQTCKLYNKRLDSFMKSKRYKDYINEVENLRSLKKWELKKVVSGKGKEQGTYLHPYLAIEFARWLDAGFAVQMDMWFESEIKKHIEKLEYNNKDLERKNNYLESLQTYKLNHYDNPKDYEM